MTPASNIDTVRDRDVLISVKQANGNTTTEKVRQLAGINRSIRPTSGNSPLRPDGTRAPKAWANRWGRTEVPFRSFGWRQSNVAYPQREGTVACFTGDTKGHVKSLGGGWTDPTYAGGGIFPPSVISAAHTKLLNKLQDEKVGLGQILGEAKRTVDGIRSLSENMLGFVDDMARYYRMEKRAVGRILAGKKPGRLPNYKGDLAKAVKGIPAAWLTTQFGIKPLLGDVHDSSEALSYYLFEEKKTPRLVVRAGHEETDEQSVTVTGSSAAWKGRLTAARQSRCHLSCIYEVPVSSARTLQQLGLGNPFSVAWELTPWSWAVDYATTMGDWINSLFANEGTRFVSGTRSLMMKIGGEEESAFWTIQKQNGFEVSPNPSSIGFLFAVGRFHREVLDGPPMPYFPTFRNRLGLNQLANLTAALSQLKK